MKLTKLMLVLMLSLALPSAALAEQNRQQDNLGVKKGLKAEQRKAIQAIGRSVLAAKHSQKQDPELKQLRQRVRELRQAVKEFNSLNFNVEQGTVAIDSSDPKAMRRQGAAKSKIHPKRQVAQEKLASALTTLRNHRMAIRDKRKKIVGGREGVLIANAMAKCEQLENEVEDFLNSDSSEQLVKIKALQNHMAPSKLREVSRVQNDTPTISTITRHRK